MLSVVTACVNKSRSDGHDGKLQSPSSEAIKACEGKNNGDTTSFKGRKGETIKATCEEIDGQITAVPEGKSPIKQ